MFAARLRSTRGAVLIHVGVAMIGLLGFCAMSIDYGILWTARRQAQNAADAAALAGAISLAFNDPADTNRARFAAESAGEANLVWGQAPIIDPATDVTIGTCPATSASAPTSIATRRAATRSRPSSPAS